MQETEQTEQSSDPKMQLPAWVVTIDWEKTIYLLFVILAIISRFSDLGSRVMSHDESLHTQYSYQFLIGDGYEHTPLMHGPFLFHATAVSYWLFGASDFSARIPVAILGVLLILIPYLLRDWLGKNGALFTSFLFLISPYLTYYSRYIRHDIYVITWAMIVIISAWRYLHKRDEKYLYLFAAGNALMFATKEVSFIYVAIFGSFFALRFIAQLLASGWFRERIKDMKVSLPLLLLSIIMLTVGAGGYYVQTREADETFEATTEIDAIGTGEEEIPAKTMRWIIIAGLVTLTASLAIASMELRPEIDQYPEFDIIVLFATLILPAVSPVLSAIVGWNPRDYSIKSCAFPGNEGLTGLSLFFTKMTNSVCINSFLTSGLVRTSFFLILTFSIAIYFGLWWHKRRFLTSAAIFHIIFAVLYTSVFTNPNGWTSGMIGSLGYWLEQQEVQRGSQPNFYYLIVVTIYEFLPMIFALLATGRWLKLQIGASFNRDEELPVDREASMRSWFGFLPMLFWWTIMTWAAYTAAGEKMPWLSTHFTIPMGLMAGWYANSLLKENGSFLSRQTLRYFGMSILILILGSLAFAPLWLGQVNFSEQTATYLRSNGRFLGALISLIGASYFLFQLRPDISPIDRKRSWVFALFTLLSLLTIRVSYTANFINPDYTNEFLVYAHGAPATKQDVLYQVETLSMRMYGDKSIKVAFDNDSSWPFTWYLRDYPNRVYFGDAPSRTLTDSPVVIVGSANWGKVEPFLRDDYEEHTYTFLWWPMEKYRDINWNAIVGDRDVAPEFRRGLGNADVREALWDIFFYRDYKKYGEVFGGNYSLGEWPLRHDLKLYIRRDVLSDLWDYGTTAANITPPVDPYANAVSFEPNMVIGSPNEALFTNPRNIAISPDGGTLFIADSGAHQIQVFDSNGNFLRKWGSQGAEAGQFNEPWGITADDQFIYVADTWNHRIQKFDYDGTYIMSIGQGGSPAADDIGGGLFFGPRDVRLLNNGFLLVTDTGNHRVQLFDTVGNFVEAIGSNGFEPGQFNEPVGLGVSADGFLYLADTWNGRIQKFSTIDSIQPIYQWDVDAWGGNSIQNKPYLAVDPQGRVYTTDPEGFRVLVFDDAGEFILRFGQFGTEPNSFGLPNGIKIDSIGNIYIVDSNNHRIIRYPPLPVE